MFVRLTRQFLDDPIRHQPGLQMAVEESGHLKSGLVPDWIIQKLAREPDKQKASIEIFSDIVTGLKDLCQGVHIITIGAEEKLVHYLHAAKLK